MKTFLYVAYSLSHAARLMILDTSSSVGYWTTPRYANSWIAISQTGHLVDWSACSLNKSRTRQLANPPVVAVLVVITLICSGTACFCSKFKLVICYCYVILCPYYDAVKTKTTITTSGGIHELTSPRVDQSARCPVHELSSP